MITLTGGGVQNLAGTTIASGSITLVLQQDCRVIANPAQVVSAIPKTFRFDVTGNLSGTDQIWSNAELTPACSYIANVYDSNGARINANPMIWTFNQVAGSSVDIGTIIPS